VYVLLGPPTAAIQSGNTTICSIFYRAIGVEIPEFTAVDSWFKDGVEIDIENDPGKRLKAGGGLEFLQRTPEDAGLYHFTATNELGTAVSNKIIVTFLSKYLSILAIKFLNS
jgi:hypothetical protein